MARKKKQKDAEEEVSGLPALSGIGIGVEGVDEIDYGEDADAGLEDVKREETVIPFLNILQKVSPQVDEDSSGYIEGAKAGMIYNSLTEELIPSDQGVLFIPVHREHVYMEWKKRTEGGGLVGRHSPTDPMVIAAKEGGAFGKLETPDGNDLVETFYLFGVAVSEADGSYLPAVISFSSTQIKAFRRWFTQMRTIKVVSNGRRVNPPMFAHMYRLKTTHQENQKGSWYGWHIRFAFPANPEKGLRTPAEASRLPQTHELYIAAKGLREMVLEGEARASYETSDGGESDSDDASVGTSGGDDETF